MNDLYGFSPQNLFRVLLIAYKQLKLSRVFYLMGKKPQTPKPLFSLLLHSLLVPSLVSQFHGIRIIKYILWKLPNSLYETVILITKLFLFVILGWGIGRRETQYDLSFLIQNVSNKMLVTSLANMSLEWHQKILGQ